MKSDLDELIEYYESERDRFDALLKESLAEFDYLAANAFSQVFWGVKRQLDVLYKIKDPTYPKKKNLLRSKELFENKFFDSPHIHNIIKTERDRDAVNRFREEELERIKAELDKIKNYKVNPSVDKEEFDDAIYELYEKKISVFKLHLKRKRDLYLLFERTEEEQLTISFPPLEDLESVPWNDHYLIKMGFFKNEATRRIEYKYDLSSFKNSLFLKTIVARIVFDVFTHWGIDNPAHIEIVK